MYYITVKQPPMFHQMTLDEFLFETDYHPQVINWNTTNTRTYEMRSISSRFTDRVNAERLIYTLRQFNNTYEELRLKPRKDLYREFHIPKKSGGLRKIDAPKPELMDALRRLKTIFEEDFCTDTNGAQTRALYHTSAFAYIRQRSTIDAVKRHQKNESKWFGKYDLSNFFGSTTQEFVMKMFSMVFPFSEVVNAQGGQAELSKALELAFLDGGLPQGTPVSPLITNIMMIPVDYKLANAFRDFRFTNADGEVVQQRFVYTRYADDFLISSKYAFSFREVEKFIVDTLKSFEAPFTIKSEKTRYGSSAGRNWNLGIMLNKDNNLTVGHKKKRQFQAMLSSYVMDKKNGTEWDKNDIQVMEGYRNYYRMIEGETIDKIVEHIGQKFNVNIVQMIKEDLRA